MSDNLVDLRKRQIRRRMEKMGARIEMARVMKDELRSVIAKYLKIGELNDEAIIGVIAAVLVDYGATIATTNGVSLLRVLAYEIEVAMFDDEDFQQWFGRGVSSDPSLIGTLGIEEGVPSALEIYPDLLKAKDPNGDDAA